MGLTKVNQENEGASPSPLTSNKNRKSSVGKSLIQQKSMIPVPKTSLKGDENVDAADLSLKARRPLAQKQHSESPQVGKAGSKTPAVTVTKSENKGTPSKGKSFVEKGTGTDKENRLSASIQLHRALPGTPQNSPSKSNGRKSGIVGNKAGLKLKTTERTEEEESIAYWKELAESRRQALDAALQENYELHNRVDELKKENAELEELVNEGRHLAEMINAGSGESTGKEGRCKKCGWCHG